VSEALIDLGELPNAGRPKVRAVVVTRPPRPYRTVLALLAIALVATLTGAAHTSPPAPPRIIAARLGDATFITGDRLFVVGSGPAQAAGGIQNKIISTYALPAGNLLSLTTVTVTGTIFDVAAAGRLVLVSYQVDAVGAESTVALLAGTDRAIWRRPARMLGLSRADGLVLLRENSPQFGPLHWYGIDLASGNLRWSLEQPARGYLTEADDDGSGFPRDLVAVAPDGTLTVRNAVTGAVTATTTIPVPADWAQRGIALWPDDNLVLVGDHTGATAYALSDLTERWRSPIDLYSSYVGPGCGDAMCLFSPRGGGITVLDRATGHARWSSNRWSYGDRIGPYLLAGSGDGTARNEHLDVVDIATGHLNGDFGPWQTTGAVLPGGSVVGLRGEPVDDLVWYGTLDPATLGVRILGAADKVSGDCQVTADVLVCRRTDASVGIWRLTGRI
jgi:hypothetical protein